MSPAIEKLEALLARVQTNRAKPRPSGAAAPAATRAQPLALDEPLHLPPVTELAAAPAAAIEMPAVARAPQRPVEDEEPEITVGQEAAEEADEAEETGERLAAAPPAAVAAPIVASPTPARAPATAAEPSPPPAARVAPAAPARPPVRPAAPPPTEMRAPTPARAPAAGPVSEEVPTTTREAPAPTRKPVEAAPLPASAAVAQVTGAPATVPRTFGAMVSRSLALKPRR